MAKQEQEQIKSDTTMPAGVLAMEDVNGVRTPTAFVGDYMGKKVLTLTKWSGEGIRGARPFDFTFGKAKAEMILKNIEAIRKYVSL